MPEQTSRDHILQVAEEFFTTKGFANTSVREICAQAGVSPPTIYYHFGDKGGLFEAVVENTLSLDGFHDLLWQELAAAPSSQAKLRAYIRTYLAHFPTHLLNPGLHFQDSTQPNGASLRRIQAGISGVYQITKDLIEEGIEAGEFRPVDVDSAASCLMGTVDSYVRAQVYLGVSYDPQEAMERIVDLFTDGLRAKRHRAS